MLSGCTPAVHQWTCRRCAFCTTPEPAASPLCPAQVLMHPTLHGRLRAGVTSETPNLVTPSPPGPKQVAYTGSRGRGGWCRLSGPWSVHVMAGIRLSCPHPKPLVPVARVTSSATWCRAINVSSQIPDKWPAWAAEGGGMVQAQACPAAPPSSAPLPWPSWPLCTSPPPVWCVHPFLDLFGLGPLGLAQGWLVTCHKPWFSTFLGRGCST